MYIKNISWVYWHWPCIIAERRRDLDVTECYVPFLLRDAEGGIHTLTGETYLHGYMNGEMEDENGGKFWEVSII